MTREEAIKVLKEISATLKSWSGFTEYPQAIDTAIETLQELPKRRKEVKRWKTKALQAEPVKTLKQIPEACKNCSNHPSNGGSGICFCTLGSMTTTY